MALGMFVQGRLGPYMTGFLSLVPPVYMAYKKRDFRRRSARGAQAAFCYNSFLRHLIHLRESGFGRRISIIAEVGPGASIGVGLAALIFGAKRYYAFDKVAFADLDCSLSLFDELVGMFRSQMPLATEDVFPETRIPIKSPEFPAHLCLLGNLAASLADNRLSRIRQSLVRGTNDFVSYVAPWTSVTRDDVEPIHLLMAHDVMEHVDELDDTYRRLAQFLAPGAAFSNHIDFKCHNLFKNWDDHWYASEWQWKLIRGRKPVLLNRMPYSAHEQFLVRAGFSICRSTKVFAAPSYSGVEPSGIGGIVFQEEDRSIQRAHVVAELPVDNPL